MENCLADLTDPTKLQSDHHYQVALAETHKTPSHVRAVNQLQLIDPAVKVAKLKAKVTKVVELKKFKLNEAVAT